MSVSRRDVCETQRQCTALDDTDVSDELHFALFRAENIDNTSFLAAFGRRVLADDGVAKSQWLINSNKHIENLRAPVYVIFAYHFGLWMLFYVESIQYFDSVG